MTIIRIAYHVILDLFITLLLVYIGSLALEGLFPGTLVRYVNVTYIGVGAIVSGALVLLLPNDQPARASTGVSIVCSVGIGFVVGTHIFSATQSLGFWAWLFATGGALIVCFPFFVLHSNNSSNI